MKGPGVDPYIAICALRLIATMNCLVHPGNQVYALPDSARIKMETEVVITSRSNCAQGHDVLRAGFYQCLRSEDENCKQYYEEYKTRRILQGAEVAAHRQLSPLRRYDDPGCHPGRKWSAMTAS